MKFIFDKMKKKTYTFDINDITYSVKIKKTLIIDQIDSSESWDQRSLPHSPPSLMGRVTYTSSKDHDGTSSHAHDKLLHFDFAIEKIIETIPGQDADTIDLVPCFNPSVIHVPPIITETIKMCIKNYYHEFLSTLK